MLSDLRFAFRQIARHPGYAAVVVLTLGFGIAVNTQIFSIVSSMFLKPMPVRNPDRLVAVIQRSQAINLPHNSSFPDFQDLRASSKNLGDAIAFLSTPAHMNAPGKVPSRVWIEVVTPDAFQKLGVPVLLGRSLQPSDGELPPATPVAVLTHRYWQNQLGGDPGVIGRTLIINGKPFTVVGVAKPGFESFTYMLSVSAFVPSGILGSLRPDGDKMFGYRSANLWNILCYLKPGASLHDANAEITVFSERLVRDFPSDHRGSRFQAVLEQRARPVPTLTDFTPVFVSLFLGLVVLVLAIACANVSNLMAAQAVCREKELVIRSALGASRARLVRQLLVESVLLALIAGFAGYLLSCLGSGLLQQFVPSSEFPTRDMGGNDWRVGAFTAAISLFAGLAAGLFPALRSSRIDLNDGLKQSAGQQGQGRHWMRNALVIGQVAISCVVLVASALFYRGLHAAHTVNLGFNPAHLLTVSLDLELQGYNSEKGLRFQKQVLDDVAKLPGVESAAFTQHLPFSTGTGIVIRMVYPDNPAVSLPDGHASVALSAVTPGYLSMMEIPLLKGRGLLPSDDEKAPPVAVINEAMARAFWPGRDPIGQHFHRDWQGAPAIEVVGVVPTGKYLMLGEEPRPYFYCPYAQSYGMPATLIIRTSADPRSLVHQLPDTLRAIDPDLPVYHLSTFEEHLTTSAFGYMPLRMGATLAGIQGSLALVLAILGLYSVVSYSVNRRIREIGVRMALGATGEQVMLLISRDGLRLTLTGLAIGLVLSLLLSLGLSRILYGVSPADPLSFIAVTAVLTATAALACALPARRAARVDPMVALRSE